LFWEEVLEPNLDKKHQAKPVHTVVEIEMLQQKFPDNIRHFNVYHKDKIVAGTTIFISENVAHPQYVSGMSNKNELGTLDFLYYHLITSVFKDKRFFDFGISNEEQGKKLNEGLVFWKESFGASIIIQDFFEVKTSNYHLLDTVLI
jgi:lipid II:glycine glycyltransferase (peptidoglycan interpeptide bridge formation enzyme)